MGDFNGDGISDLAVANAGNATVSVLLDRGDGTFVPQQALPAGPGPADRYGRADRLLLVSRTVCRDPRFGQAGQSAAATRVVRRR
jgi:hypothetical protein